MSCFTNVFIYKGELLRCMLVMYEGDVGTMCAENGVFVIVRNEWQTKKSITKYRRLVTKY
jgi:hypothetical protein